LITILIIFMAQIAESYACSVLRDMNTHILLCLFDNRRVIGRVTLGGRRAAKGWSLAWQQSGMVCLGFSL